MEVRTSPHPGNLSIFEPGYATTLDPAVDYETVGAEVIQNVYQTLVTYAGNSTDSFVPVLATCVPGTVQCAEDYGTSLIKAGNVSPEYWTFVLDPAAHFYAPASNRSWGVYPSDVMFSVARELAWSDPVGATAGWVLGQALLPEGSPTWDSGVHYPLNNTPARILGSMLINDSAYCPTGPGGFAGHGCITFVADGNGSAWPQMLKYLADQLAGSIVPCGWFTWENSGLPGWNGTHAPYGAGSCALPNGGTTTNSSSWRSYLAGLAPTGWDAFESLIRTSSPFPQPDVSFSMAGSGPYYLANVTAEPVDGGWSGYSLAANPGYEAPSGCLGEYGLFPYNGSCEPAAGSYIPNVTVTWTPAGDDYLGLTAATNGTADLAVLAQASNDTSSWISLEDAGKVVLAEIPSESLYELNFNLNWSVSTYRSDGLPGSPTVGSDFFAPMAARGLLAEAYPYSAVENSVWTVDGIRYGIPTGGPIPKEMQPFSSSIYPPSGNVSFPNGTPDPNPSDVGGAAWWWQQGRTPSSPYYDAELAACSPVAPCVFPVVVFADDPVFDAAVTSFVGSVATITNSSVRPYEVELPFGSIFQNLTSPGSVPFPMYTAGWAPDYPDPADYTLPYVDPLGTYGSPDALGPTMGLAQYDDGGACGHAATTFSDLAYWAQLQTITPACQGVAYGVAEGWSASLGSMPTGAPRVLDYNLVSHVLNALGLYIWMAQSNEVVGIAPWINESSVNTNPVFGGNGDQYWFELRYVSGPASSPTPIEVGTAPGTPMYDPVNNEIYVPNGGSASVSVLSGSTDQVLATVPVGSDPQTPVLDPVDGKVFVANFLSGNVSILNGSTNLVESTRTVGTGPHAPTYDPASGRLFVANNGSNDVSVLDGSTDQVVATVPTGTEPETPALDTTNGLLYIPNYGSANVTVLNGSTDLRLASVPVGTGPASPVYDPASGDIYVPNYGANTVSVIYGATNTVVATILVGTAPFSPRTAGPAIFSRTTVPVGHPLYDPSNGDVYVVDAGSDNVSVLSGATRTLLTEVSVGSGPQAPVYDPSDGNVYVANNGSANVSVISDVSNEVVGSVATGANPAPPVFDNASGKLYVPNTGSANVSPVASSYYLTLKETGLPAGAPWQVVVGAAPTHTASIFSRTTVPFAVSNGSFPYTIVGPHGYRLAPTFPPVGTFSVTGADVPITVPFVAGTTSTLTFHESGLPKGVEWCATVGWAACSTTSSLVFANLTPWQYPFSVAPLPGFTLTYAHGGKHFEAPPTGLANVTGRTLTVKVKFTAVTYVLTIEETGLPAGQAWAVRITSTYYGRPESKHVRSKLAYHAFTVPNGTYAYTVTAVPGYTATLSGTVPVNGSPATVLITFART